MHNKQSEDSLDSLELIKTYLMDHKTRSACLNKTNYDDYILSISEALSKVRGLLKQNDKPIENLTDIISLEALKQGMIIHFDEGKKIS